MAAVPGLMIPARACTLLVPAATVAEIISTPPEVRPLPLSPDWVLGYIRWRNYPVTLVSFDAIASDRETAGFSRVTVFYPLPGRETYDYFALAMNGDPRSLEVTDAAAAGPLPPGVSGHYAAGTVSLENQVLVIPDFEALKAAFYPQLSTTANVKTETIT